MLDPDLTLKLHPTVPSGPWLQEGAGGPTASTGVPVTVVVGGLAPPVKPEPDTDTATPPAPEFGERTILGRTENVMVGVAEVPLGYVVTLMGVVTAPAVDPTATLNPARSFPLLP